MPLGAFLIIAALVVYMRRLFQPAPVGVARAEERLQISTALRAEARTPSPTMASSKTDNGVYRLPIRQAVTLWAGLNRDGNAAGRAADPARLGVAQTGVPVKHRTDGHHFVHSDRQFAGLPGCRPLGPPGGRGATDSFRIPTRPRSCRLTSRNPWAA